MLQKDRSNDIVVICHDSGNYLKLDCRVRDGGMAGRCLWSYWISICVFVWKPSVGPPIILFTVLMLLMSWLPWCLESSEPSKQGDFHTSQWNLRVMGCFLGTVGYFVVTVGRKADGFLMVGTGFGALSKSSISYGFLIQWWLSRGIRSSVRVWMFKFTAASELISSEKTDYMSILSE